MRTIVEKSMNPDAVGSTGDPFEVTIERGRVRQFAQAVLASHPEYLKDATPVIPPTFLAIALPWPPERGSPLWAADIDERRALHGEQEFVFSGPPPEAGATLTATTSLEQITEKKGRRSGAMSIAVFATEFRGSSGRLAATSRTTVIETAEVVAE